MEAGVGEGGGGTVKIHGLSVIIPNHNHGRFLDVSILSSLNFHGIDVEIIVVDDASTDDSLEILEKYSNNKRIKIVKQPSQKGIAYTRINGFKNATKEYITAIDADDSFLKNGMKLQIDAMNKHEADGCWCCWRKYKDELVNKNYDTQDVDNSVYVLNKSLGEIICAGIVVKAVEKWIESPDNGMFSPITGIDYTAGWVARRDKFIGCGILNENEIQKLSLIENKEGRDELYFYSDFIVMNRNVIAFNGQLYLYRLKPYLDNYENISW